MEIYVYDFDKTIYAGDSSVDFFLFILLKKPLAVLRIIPFLVRDFMLFFLKKLEKETLKGTYFSFLKYVKNEQYELIAEFWNKNEKKLKKWYMEKEHDKDVIISASPEFLLKPVASRIGVKKLIASVVDSESGKFLSKNCYGEEKVRRLNQEMGSCEILECYSDSYSDSFLFSISQKSYLVKGTRIIELKPDVKHL